MPKLPMKSSSSRLLMIGLLALYLLLAELMTLEFSGNRAVGFLWLSSGLALAAVLLKGYRFLAVAFVGALLGNLLSATPVSFALLDATRHTAMIFLGAWALKRQSGFDPDLKRLQDFLHLLAVALACGLFVALMAPLIEWLSGSVGHFSFDQRLTGHILGIAVLTPLVLVWRRRPQHWAAPRVAAEAALVIGLSTAVGQAVFLGWQADGFAAIAQGYWLFFLIGWAAIRLGPHGAILVAAVAALQGLLGAQQGIGYFSANTSGDKLDNYFFYMLSLAVVGMVLATYITELKAKQALLRESLGTLRNFLETTLDGFWRVDSQGHIIDVNAAYCKQSGYSRSELIARHISDFDVSLSPIEITQYIQGITYSGRKLFETTHRRKDGSIWHIEASATCQNAATGELFVVLRDITERTEREAQLLRTQDRLSLAQQASGSGLWDLELASGLISWTPECLVLMGLTLTPDGQQPSFNEWLNVIHPDDQARAQQTVEAAIQDQSTLFCEYRIALPDGTERWIGAYGDTIHSAQGQALHLFGICIDISPQKKAQGQMAEGEVFNRAILNSLSAKIAVLDAAGVIVTVNDAWLTTEDENNPATALPFPDQLIPLTFVGINYLQICQAGEMQSEAPGPIIAKQAHQGISAVLAGRLPSFHLEYPCHTEQRQYWFSMSVTPLIAGTRGVVVSHVDITSIKQAQAELSASQELLQSVVEHMPAGVFWKDKNFRFLGCNTQFANDVGFERKEVVVGKTDFELFDSAQAKFYRSSDQAVLVEEASKLNLEILSLAPDGRPIWLNSSKVALRDSKDHVVGILGMYTDITEKKHHSLELEEHRNHLEELVARRTLDLSAARDAAEAANRSKADFLANMSHEIRSPLNAILGLAYLLEQANLNLAAQTMVRKIRSSGRLLLSLITDILDVSKIEAGQMAIEQAPFQLSDVIDNLAVALGVAVGEKSLELIIHPLPAGVSAVMGDALRLEQVLVNLCNNAIKFTPAGRVELQTDLLSRDERGLITLRFRVLDTGIGIAPEMQSNIFAAFTQADSSTTRRFGGTGLGLTICRQLVNLMGGEIGLSSNVGQGSEFWFTLPLQTLGDISFSSPPVAQIDALIADDSEIALKAISSVAQGLGWQVRGANSGVDVVAQVLARKTGKCPDVVVLDWQMPGMDGLAAARAIRKGVPQHECPIVIMATAYSLTALAALPGADQVDSILHKPVTASGLFNAVMEAQQRRAKSANVVTETAKLSYQGLAGIRLLVVDDNEMNRELAQSVFASQGASVTLAVDGQDALDWLLAHPLAVDLVLMDVQMPVLDGLEATRRLRKLPQFNDLPIVALTAGAFKSQEEAARAAGMAHFISKPFDVPTTVALIQRLRRPRPEPGLPDTAIHAAPPAAPPQEQALPMPAKPQGAARPKPQVLNIEQGLTLWNDEAIYRAYLRRFVDSYSEAAQDMTRCLAAADTAGAAALAHKLAGVAANLALPDTRRLASEIEQLLSEPSELVRDLGPAAATVTARAGLALALAAAVDAVNLYAPLAAPATSPAAPITAPISGPTVAAPLVSDDGASPSADSKAVLELKLEQQLIQLLAALDTDSTGPVKKVLTQMAELLPPSVMNKLWAPVLGYDFRAAEASALQLAQDYGIKLGTQK